MSGALDTKTDPLQLPVGKLLELENGFRQRNGELVKRYGYETLGTSIIPSGTLADGRRMALFGDELNVITNKSMYTYSDDNDSWVRKGPLETLSVDQFPIVANSYEQSTADSATNGKIALYAWEDSRTSPASIRYSIIDRSSDSVIVGDSQLVASGSKPHCVAIANKIMVFVQEVNTLKCYIFNVETPTTAPTSITIGADLNTSGISDMIPFYGAILFCYATTANTIKLGYVTQFGVLGGGTTGYPSIVTYNKNAEIAMTIFSTNDNRFNLVWANATGGAGLDGLRHIGVFASLDTTAPWLSETQLDSYVGTAVTRIRNVTGFQSGDLIHTYWDKDDITAVVVGGVTTYPYRWRRSVNDTHRRISTGAVSAGAGNLRSVSLAGKAFYADNDGFIPVAFWSETQPTLFLLRNDGDISAKMLPAYSNGQTAKSGHLPNVTNINDERWVFPTQYRARIQSENSNKLFTLTGITEVILNFDDQFICDSAKLGENLQITSGYLQSYDGISIFESGFHLYPDNITLADIAGTVPAGTYQFRVVYEWTDSRNQIHRSSPSLIYSITTAANKSFNITVPYLYVTDRKGDRTNVVIAVYRTEKNGTIFYKSSSISAPTYNDTTAAGFTVTINDNLDDATLITREILYTTGGVLENIAPPACKIIARFKNRLFLAGLEQKNVLWYSKEHVEGESINFSDVLKIKVDDTGGNITALGELDDKLIIFKANTVFALIGDGPLPTGAQNTFSVPQLVASDVGCIDPYSVVRTRLGLMFKSKKGIYLLDRGLQVQYIGAEVEEWNDLTITSSSVVDEQNQVRFTTSEGRCLVYDLYFQQWYTFTNIPAIDSAVWQGKYVFLKSTAEIWRETKGQYLDVDVPIISTYVLALLQFGQVQGFQRIFKINLLGDNRGTHGLKIEVGYDYRDFYEERWIVYPDTVLFDSVWGDDSVWGEAGTLWGGNYDGVYQFQIRPRQQRCQALRLKVQDFFGSGSGTAGFAFSNVTAEVGIEPNVARLAKTKIIAP
jgi:hypothetical protein